MYQCAASCTMVFARDLLRPTVTPRKPSVNRLITCNRCARDEITCVHVTWRLPTARFREKSIFVWYVSCIAPSKSVMPGVESIRRAHQSMAGGTLHSRCLRSPTMVRPTGITPRSSSRIRNLSRSVFVLTIRLISMVPDQKL